jgi:hypothetical protein
LPERSLEEESHGRERIRMRMKEQDRVRMSREHIIRLERDIRGFDLTENPGES